MRELIGRFVWDASGAAAAEYGLIAAGLSLAIVTAMQGIGARLAISAAGMQIAMR